MDMLVVALVLTLALVAIKISNRSGIPELLLFTVLGVAFSFFGYDFDNYQLANGFSSVALMVIMFHGGFGTNWNMAKPVAVESMVLSFFGTIATGVLTGLFIWKVLGFSYIDAMLIGSIVGSTDFSSVSNILRSRNLNLKYNTSSLLEVESGSNDPTAYTMTMVFLSQALGESTSLISIIIMIVQQMGLGLLFGFLMAKVTQFIKDKVHFDGDGLFIIFIIAMAMTTFAITDTVGGNGYMALYVLGIMIGNTQFRGKRDTVFFFDGLSSLMHIGLFFMLGLLSDPERFLAVLPTALAITIFMMIIARPLAVFGFMIPFNMNSRHKGAISLAGIRGAAAIAFAIMAVTSPLESSVDIYHLVFGVAITSSLIQGSLMAPLVAKLDMLDPQDTVLKTFNDYQDKSDVGFLETKIHPGNRWIGRRVMDINMAFDIVVAKIERDGVNIIPRGHTIIEEGDLIVLGGETHFDYTGHNLVEFLVDDNHDWVSKRVVDLDIPENQLIVMVQRDSGIIVPTGDTVIQADDTVITITGEEHIAALI